MKWSLEEQPQEKVDIMWILKDLMPRDLSPLGRVIAENPGRGGTARLMTAWTVTEPLIALQAYSHAFFHMT